MADPFVNAREHEETVARQVKRAEAAERRVAELQRVGDALQSEGSRLAAWARPIVQDDFRHYETAQAVLGVESAVEKWTELRMDEQGCVHHFDAALKALTEGDD